MIKSSRAVKSSLNEQLEDLGEIVEELLARYYENNKVPMRVTALLNNRVKFIAPMASNSYARKWLEDNNKLKYEINHRGHLYAFPYGLSEQDRMEGMWQAEEKNYERKAKKNDSTW